MNHTKILKKKKKRFSIYWKVYTVLFANLFFHGKLFWGRITFGCKKIVQPKHIFCISAQISWFSCFIGTIFLPVSLIQLIQYHLTSLAQGDDACLCRSGSNAAQSAQQHVCQAAHQPAQGSNGLHWFCFWWPGWLQPRCTQVPFSCRGALKPTSLSSRSCPCTKRWQWFTLRDLLNVKWVVYYPGGFRVYDGWWPCKLSCVFACMTQQLIWLFCTTRACCINHTTQVMF